MGKSDEPEITPVLDWLKERKSFLSIFRIPFFKKYKYVRCLYRFNSVCCFAANGLCLTTELFCGLTNHNVKVNGRTQ